MNALSSRVICKRCGLKVVEHQYDRHMAACLLIPPNDELRRMYLEDETLTVSDLAKRVGTTITEMSRRLRRAGVTPRQVQIRRASATRKNDRTAYWRGRICKKCEYVIASDPTDIPQGLNWWEHVDVYGECPRCASGLKSNSPVQIIFWLLRHHVLTAQQVADMVVTRPSSYTAVLVTNHD